VALRHQQSRVRVAEANGLNETDREHDNQDDGADLYLENGSGMSN
jgi:hypothetical protein